MRPDPRLGPTPIFAALGSALLLLGVLIAVGPGEMFAALPFALIVVALVFQRFPGEQLIERLARRLRRPRPRPVSVGLPARHATPFTLRLLASISVLRPQRGPPLLSSH